jgi:hydrogenase maturation protease
MGASLNMSAYPLLILGIGNCLVGDDGIGVHAVRELQSSPPPGIPVVEVGTDFFSALLWMPLAAKVLAIDAMDAGKPPGTLYRCALDAIEEQVQPVSVHELGLRAMLEYLGPDERPEITVLGIQPDRIAWGLELSPILSRTLPDVVRAARALAAQLIGGTA